MPAAGSHDEPSHQQEHDEEDTMSTYYYGPALESELEYRRTILLHDAEVDRLAREARLTVRAARAARRFVTASSGRVEVAPDSPTTAVERPAARAA
jgi:hypothetical protein